MDEPSAPLADYFWIAGIESIAYQDFPSSATPTQFDTIIAEDGEDEEDESNGILKRAARHSQQNASNRLSKASVANTVNTLDESDGNTISNRSSATIRAINLPAAAPNQDGLLSMADFDFDKALVKFAAERENFLDDLSFSAGAKTQARPPMVNPRTERIKADENASGRLSPLKSIRGSIRGSIRRKISFKDMNSARKPPAPPKPGKLEYSGCPCRLLPGWACGFAQTH